MLETEVLCWKRSLVLETEGLMLETESCAGNGVLCSVLRKRRLETAIFQGGAAKTLECFGWKLWHVYAGSALRRLKGSLSLSSLLLGLLVVLRVFMGV